MNFELKDNYACDVVNAIERLYNALDKLDEILLDYYQEDKSNVETLEEEIATGGDCEEMQKTLKVAKERFELTSKCLSKIDDINCNVTIDLERILWLWQSKAYELTYLWDINIGL